MEKLLAFSHCYGADTSLVIAGGGNTSMKENGILYIKGSGTALSNIRAEEFVKMDLAKLLEIPQKTYPAEDAPREAAFLADIMAARLPGEENKRPSVETLLHALFPQKYILHLHPTLVNGLTCSKNGKSKAAELFPDAVWVDECRPGYTLAMRLAEKISGGTDTVLLQNHGVFYAADTSETLDHMLTGMLSKLQTAFEQNYNAELDIPPSLEHPFTPDHIVYCGLGPVLPDTENAALLWNDAQKIAHYAAAFGGMKPMSNELVTFITHWEAESYRKKQE